MRYIWQFSLRDCFWLILAVALTLGWGLDHFRLQANLAQADAYGKHTRKQFETVVSIWNYASPSSPIDASRDGVVMKLKHAEVDYLMP